MMSHDRYNLLGKVLGLTALMLLLFSCGTVRKVKSFFVDAVEMKNFSNISSVPAGADILTENGDVIGVTPFKITDENLKKYSKGGHLGVMLRKPGYIPRELVVPTKGINVYQVKLSPLNSDHFKKWILKKYTNRTNPMIRHILNIQGLLFLKKFSKAEAEVIQFQKKYPNVAASYTLLGNVYFHKNDYKRAKQQLLRALSIDEGDETIIRFLKIVNKKLANL